MIATTQPRDLTPAFVDSSDANFEAVYQGIFDNCIYSGTDGAFGVLNGELVSLRSTFCGADTLRVSADVEKEAAIWEVIKQRLDAVISIVAWPFEEECVAMPHRFFRFYYPKNN